LDDRIDDVAGAGRTTETVKANKDAIDNLAGSGRTTETVKANKDAIDNLAGAGRTTETVKGNADNIGNLAGAGRTTETVKANKDLIDAMNKLTTEGDILYRDSTGYQRLAKGTAGQSLIMNSGATAPEWSNPYYLVSASDTVILEANTERVTSETSYVLVKSFRVKFEGSYKITYEIRSTNSSYTTSADVRLNSVSKNIQTAASSSYVEKTYDLSGVKAGDLITVHIKISDALGLARIQNVKVKGTVELLVDTVVQD